MSCGLLRALDVISRAIVPAAGNDRNSTGMERGKTAKGQASQKETP
jgi:hypothetical protein